jgi:pseudoazurin
LTLTTQKFMRNLKFLLPLLSVLLFDLNAVTAEEALKERLAPVGSICMEGEVCAQVAPASSMPMTGSASSAPKVELSEGSEHIVQMLNMGEGGSMVFEPAVIKVSKGDTIHFKAVDMSHNSASLDGMIPDGASSWTGSLSKDISVKLDDEGVYVYQCDPHAMMAMVGVIQVGEAVNLSQVKEAADNKKSSFIMNSDRLQTYLSQL